MLEALAWGALAASSLVIGAWLGLARDWSARVVGLVLGFGAGALISAVSFELWEDALDASRLLIVAAGLGAGALVYFAADLALDRRMRGARTRHRPRGADEQDSGSALALGALLDGIPEQVVLGIGIAAGDGAGVALLAAIFVSNLPEAIGSASAMHAAGRSRGLVLRLWLSVVLVTTLASVAGFAAADALSRRRRRLHPGVRRRGPAGDARGRDDPVGHAAGRPPHGTHDRARLRGRRGAVGALRGDPAKHPRDHARVRSCAISSKTATKSSTDSSVCVTESVHSSSRPGVM